MFWIKTKTVLLCLLIAFVVSDITFTNSEASDTMTDFAVTLSPPDDDLNAVKIQFEIEGVTSIERLMKHSMLCFPNSDENEIPDDTLISGFGVVVTHSEDTPTSADQFSVAALAHTLTKSGDAYTAEYTMVYTVDPANHVLTGDVLTGSMDLDTSKANDLSLSLDITHAICFFSNDASINSNNLAYAEPGVISNLAYVSMVLYETPADDSSGTDIGEESSRASFLTGAFFCLLTFTASLLI